MIALFPGAGQSSVRSRDEARHGRSTRHGWEVKPDPQGWRFHLEPAPAAQRMIAIAPGLPSGLRSARTERVMRRAPALKSPSLRPQTAEDGFHLRPMPKIALVLVCAATAIIVVLAATVLGNIVPPAFRPRPELLAGLVVAAGIGLTAGLALLEQGPRRSLRVA